MEEANNYFNLIIEYSKGIKPKSNEPNLKSSGSGNRTPPSNRNAATGNPTPPSNRDAATGIN